MPDLLASFTLETHSESGPSHHLPSAPLTLAAIIAHLNSNHCFLLGVPRFCSSAPHPSVVPIVTRKQRSDHVVPLLHPPTLPISFIGKVKFLTITAGALLRSWGLCNRLPRPSRLKTTDIDALAALEASGLQPRSRRGWFPLRPLSLLMDGHPLLVSWDGLPTAHVCPDLPLLTKTPGILSEGHRHDLILP